MTLFNPIYRATVYAPRSVSNPNETSVLTPSSAHHSQQFKVASAQGVSGFQPYMAEIPRGRKSRLDPISKKLDIGAITITLGDYRDQGTSNNLQRWITAFIGDSTGKNRLLGLKVLIEESLDSGASWQAYYVGRITEFTLSGLTQYKVTIKEENSLQKRVKCFQGEPSASVLAAESATGYANRRLFLPMGRAEGSYGPWTTLGDGFGQWKTARSNENRVISNNLADPYNTQDGILWITKPLVEAVAEVNSFSAFNKESNVGFGPIIEVRSAFAPFGPAPKYRYYVTFIESESTGLGHSISGRPLYAQTILLEALPSGSFRRGNLSQFPDGAYIYWKILDNREISEKSPLLIGDVHPVQYWKDLLKGAFSILDNDGEAIFRDSFQIEESDFDALIADEATYKTGRFPQTKELELNKVIEEQILRPYNLAYRMEPATSSAGVGINKIVPFSMDMPADTSGIPTITTNDLVAGSKPTWEPGEPKVFFETKAYNETFKDFVEVNRNEDDNPSLWSEAPVFIRTVDLDNVHGGEGDYKVDAKGIRWAGYELVFIQGGGPVPQPIPRAYIYRSLAEAFHNLNVFRWSRGPAKVSIKAKRSGSIETTKVGDFRLLDVDFLPGEFGHVRGETRLVQCVERTEDGPNLNLQFVDSGRNIQTPAPIVGNFYQVPGTNTISGSVGVTTDQILRAEMAYTDQSVAARPATTSSLWQRARTANYTSGSHTLVLGNIPNGIRTWPRFRTQAASADEVELLSDWIYPTNDYVDITILSAPSNLTIHNITKESATLRWTNAAVTASTEVLIKPYLSASFTTATILGQGTDRYTLINLSPSGSSNPWTAGVRHIDQFGGISTTVSASFSCSGDFNLVCPAIGGIQFVEIVENTEIIPLT